MIDLDFEYDGIYLSDFGYMVCSFDGTNDNTVSEGSEITLDLTPVANGTKHLLSAAKYDTCISAEFDICKNPVCRNNQVDEESFYISYDEEREISRWLNRKEMLPFKFISEHYEGIIFNGSFNISKIELGGKVVGFHLQFNSDRPFGYLDRKSKFKISAANGKRIIYDDSDEIGSVPIDMIVELTGSGNLTITNSFDNAEVVVKNCTSGEIITFSNMQITSSDTNHMKTIMNDFNFSFPMLSNSYSDRKNEFQFSLPCNVTIEYKSIRKVGI